MRPAFVSGYLVQLTSDVEALDGPSGPTADFTDLHAWAEVYIPGAGWIGLDPTSGLFAGEGHIPLSATPPSRVGGADHRCDRAVRDHVGLLQRRHPCARGSARDAAVHRSGLGCDLRVGGPVSTDAWPQATSRLTVGGEPTFVSIDNQVDPEWTTDADGPQKRQRASALAARLKKVWAPQGLIQRSQGKWYPGEPLAALADWAVFGAPMASRCGGDEQLLGRSMADPA